MQRSLLIRVRWMPFVLLLTGGLLILFFNVKRSFRVALVKPAIQIPMPRVPLEKPPPVSQAHAGWLAVRGFERMMDSLGSCAGGKHIYDSVLAARPGILDSAKKAEAFFFLHDH